MTCASLCGVLKWLEIATVLFVGGGIGLLWATHDEGVPPVDDDDRLHQWEE